MTTWVKVWIGRSLVLALVAALLMPFMARAEEGCLADQPLLDMSWESAPPEYCGAPAFSKEWLLPVSPSHSDILTAARVRVMFSKLDPEGNWFAFIQFSFPDPKPFGIPFTFQKLKLQWQSPELPTSREVEVDWSDQCQDVGRGLFPGQSWEAVTELPGTRDLCSVSQAQLKLWGGRY